MKIDMLGEEVKITGLNPSEVYIRIKCSRCNRLGILTLNEYAYCMGVHDCHVCKEDGYDDCRMEPYELLTHVTKD